MMFRGNAPRVLGGLEFYSVRLIRTCHQASFDFTTQA